MSPERIRRKLEKLFALARCSAASPAEAAAALRQAEALQRMLAVSADPVQPAIEGLSTGVQCRGKEPTAALARLAELVAHLYGGISIAELGRTSHRWRFGSVRPHAGEICDYAFAVLSRRMALDTVTAVCRGATTHRQPQRVQAYQDGWIAGLYRHLDLRMAEVHSQQLVAAMGLSRQVRTIWASPALTSTLDRATGFRAGTQVDLPAPALPAV